ncbi:hypothetical protein HY450_03035 [Candidatus Pacearchaeota archaeon]|nr:hypothetical protein [Candidatus Pacearchaeota archaeon]
MVEKQRTITATQIGEQSTREFPVIEHEGRNLVFYLFGPGTHFTNVKVAMSAKRYSSPEFPGQEIDFSPATISQSISIAVQNPKRTKGEILDSRWLQLGPYVRASEGVFLNPPRESGEFVTDERTLNSYLTETEKVNGIFVVRNREKLRDFAFVPGDTYELGEQEHKTFLKSGLARGFEHTQEEAKRLPKIFNSGLYPEGVFVYDGFKPTNRKGETDLRVAGLNSDRDVDYWLVVCGYDWDGYGSCAFGVFDAGEAFL